MAKTTLGHDACPMRPETESVRIVVEIGCAEPFRGTIAEAGQPLRSFNGWTAFAAAIAAVVARVGSTSRALDAGQEAGS